MDSLTVGVPAEDIKDSTVVDEKAVEAKKTESRYRCCFPECHFILNKTQMKEGLNINHLTEDHKLKLKNMKNLPAGTFKFPKIL